MFRCGVVRSCSRGAVSVWTVTRGLWARSQTGVQLLSTSLRSLPTRTLSDSRPGLISLYSFSTFTASTFVFVQAYKTIKLKSTKSQVVHILVKQSPARRKNNCRKLFSLGSFIFCFTPMKWLKFSVGQCTVNTANSSHLNYTVEINLSCFTLYSKHAFSQVW